MDGVKRSPQETLPTTFEDDNPGVVALAVVVIVDGLDPDGERTLYTYRDTDAPVWLHLGMMESATGDIKATLQDTEFE